MTLPLSIIDQQKVAISTLPRVRMKRRQRDCATCTVVEDSLPFKLDMIKMRAIDSNLISIVIAVVHVVLK